MRPKKHFEKIHFIYNEHKILTMTMLITKTTVSCVYIRYKEYSFNTFILLFYPDIPCVQQTRRGEAEFRPALHGRARQPEVRHPVHPEEERGADGGTGLPGVVRKELPGRPAGQGLHPAHLHTRARQRRYVMCYGQL